MNKVDGFWVGDGDFSGSCEMSDIECVWSDA